MLDQIDYLKHTLILILILVLVLVITHIIMAI